MLKSKASHPNKLPFDGVLTLIDTVSNKAPNGSGGRKVILPREVVIEALPSLIDMAVDFKPGWEEHDNKQKIGLIKDAWVEDNFVRVSGFLYAKDFEHIISEMRRPKRPLGMSYEIAEAHIKRMSDPVWRLTKFIFTGAAILYQDKAAYSKTTFNIAASAQRQRIRNGVITLSFIDSNDVTGSIDPEERRAVPRL